MKDQEFIELLNLYVDHEISAADSARLEAEVQSNPQRRGVYTQYCRMQKACTLIGADFRAEGESAFDVAAAAQQRTQRRRQAAYYGMGTFAAAAACIALIVVGRAPQPANDSVGSPPAEIAAVTPPAAAPRVGGMVQRAMLVEDPLLLSSLSRTDAQAAVAAQQAAAQLEWLHTVKLAPLQLGVAAEGLRFDVVPASLQPSDQDLRKRHTPATNQFEWVGFEFRK